jgi:23S rRNA pseudouridine1911/1915/1917 synthase
LAEAPKADWEDIASGDWGEDVEGYMADHIPGRDFLVGLNAYFDLYTGRQVGKDIRVDQDRLVEAPVKANDFTAKRYFSVINSFADTLDRKVMLAIVPSAGWAAGLDGYEDDAIIVLNKPPYTPTHPSHGHYADTLANGLAALFERRGVPFVFRACSRHDRDTSGLVTVAKTRAAAHHFQCAHLAGTVEKTYLAVLVGHLTPQVGEIGGCIKRLEDSVITRVVTEDDGAPALTRYRVLAYGKAPDGRELTLCEAQPVTGRTHQLRVHFAHLGCPMLGDFLYGEENDTLIGRQALHCQKTTFDHPLSGRRMTLTAAPPEDFMKLYSLFDFEERTANRYAKNNA